MVSLESPEEAWIGLVDGLDRAFRLEQLNFESLYRKAYICCKSEPTGDQGHIQYQKVKKYIEDHVSSVLQQFYGENGGRISMHLEEYDNFEKSAGFLSDIFMFLHRIYVSKKLNEGSSDVFPIYTLTLNIWKEKVIMNIDKMTFIETALNLIERDRNGEVVDIKYISDVVRYLVKLENDGHEIKRDDGKSRPYKDFFEKKFLEATRLYYTREADRFMKLQGCISDYMKEVTKLLDEEESRCQLYLDPSTQQELITLCGETLILPKLELFQDHFNSILVDGRKEELKIMFDFCNKFPNGLAGLKHILEVYIEKEGQEAIQKFSTDLNVDVKKYVELLIDVHQKYEDLVETVFSSNPGFMQSLDKACMTFVNNNAVTKRFQPSAHKSAEFLAKYCDQLLRKSSKRVDDEEMEATLEKIIIIFKYLDDTDVFLKYYTRMFAKRLIADSSYSNESEASFINKLKTCCEYEYASKLTKMVEDKLISKDLVAEFKELVQPGLKKKINFDVLILSFGVWPEFSDFSINIPASLSEGIDQFTTFYREKFNGRKLTWIHSQSKGEIMALCFSKNYQLTVTTAQLVTILLFNEHDSFSMSEIVKATGMDARSAYCVVESLVKNKILKYDKRNEEGEIPLNAIISLNMDYENKKVRVDLSRMTMRSEATREDEAVRQSVEEDRKGVLKACIVRILKSRKRISHQELVAEVLQQVSAHFTPDVLQIRRCIESLIELEYMRRSNGQRDVYEYMA